MNLTARSLLKSVAATFILAVTAGSASAGGLSDIDEHARDIEREAERADRIVQYNFKNAPASLTSCLSGHLCAMAKTADRVNGLCKCDSNLDLVNALACDLNREFRDVEIGFAELQEWTQVCHVTPSGHCHSCAACRVNEYHLQRLGERLGEVRDELSCMTREVNQLVATRDALISHHHQVSGFGTPGLAPPVVLNRPAAPACSSGPSFSLTIGRPAGPIGPVRALSPQFGNQTGNHFNNQFSNQRGNQLGHNDRRGGFGGHDDHTNHQSPSRNVSSNSRTFGSRSGVGFSFSFGR